MTLRIRSAFILPTGNQASHAAFAANFQQCITSELRAHRAYT